MVPHIYAMALYNKERAPGTTEWDARVSHPYPTYKSSKAKTANSCQRKTSPIYPKESYRQLCKIDSYELKLLMIIHLLDFHCLQLLSWVPLGSINLDPVSVLTLCSSLEIWPDYLLRFSTPLHSPTSDSGPHLSYSTSTVPPVSLYL